VRSALLSVNGVSRAQVSLERQEAIVVYDPGKATVDDLIKAVNAAKGINKYSATLKSK
jgi:copper chaperone CopZ